MHKLGVYHADTKPRNMMVVPGNESKPDRVLFIDFESGNIYDPNNLTNQEEFWFYEERGIVEGFARMLAEDVAKGEIDRTWLDYYT